MNDRTNTALATRNESSGVSMGFGTLQSFEFMQRTAKMFTQSSMVPTAYRAQVMEGYGDNKALVENPSALPNCIIALNMSQRMNADPLMIMQNLNIIEGRPSWSSQFIIAAINSCGRYSPLRFETTAGEEVDASYTTFEWVDRKKVAKTIKTRVRNSTCVAWAVELATQTRLESPMVTMEMAVNEGWYGKNGSKWQSMPELMLRYRSAAFFGRIYAPELLMGLPAAEEVYDVVDVDQRGEVTAVTSTRKPSVSMPQPKVVDPETGEIDPPTASATGAPHAEPDPAPAKPRAEYSAGTLATEGERKLVLNRARSNGLDILDLIDRAGLTGMAPDLSGLTKDGFLSLRDQLPKAA